MQIINSPNAPQAIGPYSQAVRLCNLLFCSGQIALDPQTMELVDKTDVKKQTKQVCRNIGAVLKEAGVSYKNVVKTTIFLNDMSDFAAVNEIYEQYFSHKPARSTVAVASLPKGALVEIEVMATSN